MDLNHAIKVRTSRRDYLDTPILEESIVTLMEFIKEYNQKEHMHIQFVLNEPSAFGSFRKSYGLLSGVHHYIAMVGNCNDANIKEKVGYYGELLVLEATKLSLGTCWVGGTYDKDQCKCEVKKGEQLYCLIALGNVKDKESFKERMVHRATKMASNRKVSQLFETDTTPPQWVTDGMEAVYCSPSAINKMPFKLTYANNQATITIRVTTGFEQIDLGIAKLHFELGARCGSWPWGQDVFFIRNET